MPRPATTGCGAASRLRGLAVLLLLAASVRLPHAAAAETTMQTIVGGLYGRIPATRIGLEAVDVVVGPKGRLYVATGKVSGTAVGHGVVWRLDPDGLATRVAGTGVAGPLGDDGPADRGSLAPSAIAVHTDGTLYVAEARRHRIRKVTPGGIISTVAGTGTAGYAGDGGPAVQAIFDSPAGVAVDAAGNLYIADSRNARIRKVTPVGVVSTIAGTGGERKHPSAPETSTAVPVDGIAATSVPLGNVGGLTVTGSGEVYFTEPDEHLVRRIDTGGRLYTVAGGAAYWKGYGVTYSSGAVETASKFVTNNEEINKLYQVPRLEENPTWRSVKEDVGDGGLATMALLDYPVEVALGPGGDVYVSDTRGSNAPTAAAARVRRIDSSGTITTYAGNGRTVYSGDGGAADAAGLLRPHGVAVDASGNLYVADDSRVRKVAATTRKITTVMGVGTHVYSGHSLPPRSVGLSSPSDMAVDSRSTMYVAHEVQGHDVVLRVSGGRAQVVAGGAVAPSIEEAAPEPSAGAVPTDVQMDVNALGLDRAERLLIAVGRRVWRVAANGRLELFAGGGASQTEPPNAGDGGPAAAAFLENVIDLATGEDGSVYIATNWKVRRVDPRGVITTIAGSEGGDDPATPDGPALSARIGPAAIAVSPAGEVHVATGNRVRKITAAGQMVTVAGKTGAATLGDGGPATEALLAVPSGLAFDSARRLLIAEASGNRIRRVDAAGNITTIVGSTAGASGAAGFAGDGGPPAEALLGTPKTLATTGDGTLLVVEVTSNRIRGIVPPGRSTTLLSAAPARVVKGATVTLSGRLTVGGQPVSGATVDVLRRAAGSKGGYALVARRSTDAAGRFSVAHQPPSSQEYVARYAGNTTTEGSLSKPVVVTVTARR